MNHFYRVGYHGYESHGWVELMHTDKIPHDRFVQMVAEASRPVAQEYLDLHLGRIINAGRQYDCESLSSAVETTFDNIFNDVAFKMAHLFGFVRVRYEEEFSLFEMDSLCDEFRDTHRFYGSNARDRDIVADSISLGMTCLRVPPHLIKTGTDETETLG